MKSEETTSFDFVEVLLGRAWEWGSALSFCFLTGLAVSSWEIGSLVFVGTALGPVSVPFVWLFSIRRFRLFFAWSLSFQRPPLKTGFAPMKSSPTAKFINIPSSAMARSEARRARQNEVSEWEG